MYPQLMALIFRSVENTNITETKYKHCACPSIISSSYDHCALFRCSLMNGAIPSGLDPCFSEIKLALISPRMSNSSASCKNR